MTRLEAQQKAKYYYEKWQEYQREVDRMEMAFEIHDMNKPFKKYTINEIQQLYNVSEKAYEWMQENQDCSIYDYNLMALKEDKIILGK